MILAGISAITLRFLLKRENDRRDEEYGVSDSIDLSEDVDSEERLYEKNPKFRYAL